ncbi:GMC family oxidoreductase [Candidatus Lucifugimonas marina]|uniref:FAD-binding protein n=1 Tax=Candidatus Lucifugimonas marina TaxID=3038979 RepID=A0AAJ5ZHU5_9CHLR|nr:FAD-binding protein [SAR202 cluster bacterium JH702]MDG0869746.1 FAD-binding protein [SAR202 cluster bacterium JH639]WFG34474.1 FAD-binding protein [SAR202 cluster bacterium JH545]WFG38403.1 FAD-binding protein [SAR202 cluster bacterium JH1073]
MTTTDHNPDRTADVLIIGAGASGAAVAASLAEAGFDVVCIEQGNWQDASKFPTVEPDFELRQMSSWSINPNKRKLREDYPVNVDDSAIDPVMFNGVGGSTIMWAAHTPRLHPSDFRVKTLDGVADDWPITYEDLEPWYDLNDHVMGCAGIAGDPANPPRSPRQMPPVPIGKDGEMLAAAFDRLGWHWWPSDNYVNSIRYGEGRDACNFCGHNMMGCYQRAKSSTDLNYWPRAIDQGAEFVTGARVREITTDSTGRATGVNYLDAAGNDHHRKARAVVVAANGVGTPRMLLMSASDRHPNGLSNSSGMVGKNLMFHVYAGVTGVFPGNNERWVGPAANMIMSQEFYETDPSRGFVRGYSYQSGRGPGGPGAAARGGKVPWGAGHHEQVKRRLGNTVGLGVIGDDLPEEHNTVTLDPRLTDSSGLPAPKITYTVSKNSRALLDHGLIQAQKVMEEAGADEVDVNRFSREAGWHLMGTARMGDDPERSVVDSYGQSHDIDNLFIVDGSVFVTGGAVNPTPTIQAIALRAADYIVNERQDLKS